MMRKISFVILFILGSCLFSQEVFQRYAFGTSYEEVLANEDGTPVKDITKDQLMYKTLFLGDESVIAYFFDSLGLKVVIYTTSMSKYNNLMTTCTTLYGMSIRMGDTTVWRLPKSRDIVTLSYKDGTVFYGMMRGGD
jgi:hypothetical protein